METRKGNQNYRSFLWYREIGFGEGKGNRFPPMANQWKNAIREGKYKREGEEGEEGEEVEEEEGGEEVACFCLFAFLLFQF